MAGIIDAMIGLILSALVVFVLTFVSVSLDRPEPIYFDAPIMIRGTALVLFLLLNAYPLARSGQTMGKLVLAIQVVAQTSNKVPPLSRLLGVRYFPLWMTVVHPAFSILILLSGVYMLRNDRRCIHDLAAGTHVVKVDG